MVIDMNEAKLDTIEQIREFLKGTANVAFSTPTDESRLRGFVASPNRKQRLHWTRTRPSPVTIGIRKAPAPEGLR